LSNPDDPHAGKAIRAFETSTSTFDNARYFFINFLDLPPKTKGSESIGSFLFFFFFFFFFFFLPQKIKITKPFLFFSIK